MKSKGLGDSIKKLTDATGISWFVEKMIPNCGCDNRQEWLNETFPYKHAKTRERVILTEEQRSKLENLLDEVKPDQITKEQNARLTALHNEVFGRGKRPKMCGKCIKETMTELLIAYEQNS